ncbi:hypothetical protein [Streptomyces sp. AP-93]|uniref:hypothetical protein n=1 Tax=Streptomyces sp. AP-93 TaxID=2929048 RepID=UPI001FB00191|nr:hypothetical protein [Streptomyces sp. AP-93]MCJ0869010.1 hypothetical protein [Streptomyces sp. AP-93]
MVNAESPDAEHSTLGRAIARLVDSCGTDIAMKWRKKTGVLCHDKHLIPAMGKPHSGRWDTESDAVLWYLLRLYITGNLVMAHIPVGATPLGDKERRRNQEILDQAQLRGVTAVVDQQQSGAPCDGWVRIKAAGMCERLTFKDTHRGTSHFSMDGVEFTPHVEGDRGIPLEIGNSDITRTLAHLRQYGAVVRWPYGSDNMILLTLHGDVKVMGLDAFFAKDMRANVDKTQSLVLGITSAMDEALYVSQISDALFDLPPEVAADREFELRVAAIMAARLVRAIPIAMFVHVDRKITGHSGPPTRMVSEENGVTKVVSRGVTVYAKAAGPQHDCADPMALKLESPPGPYSQLGARLRAASPSGLIAVPPTIARSYLRTAVGNCDIEELHVLFEAVDELQRQGLEPSAAT